MADKTWVVSHARAHGPIVVTGKNLDEALAKEGLNPNIWKPVSSGSVEEIPAGAEPGSEPLPD